MKILNKRVSGETISSEKLSQLKIGICNILIKDALLETDIATTSETLRTYFETHQISEDDRLTLLIESLKYLTQRKKMQLKDVDLTDSDYPDFDFEKQKNRIVENVTANITMIATHLKLVEGTLMTKSLTHAMGFIKAFHLSKPEDLIKIFKSNPLESLLKMAPILGKINNPLMGRLLGIVVTTLQHSPAEPHITKDGIPLDDVIRAYHFASTHLITSSAGKLFSVEHHSSAEEVRKSPSFLAFLNTFQSDSLPWTSLDKSALTLVLNKFAINKELPARLDHGEEANYQAFIEQQSTRTAKEIVDSLNPPDPSPHHPTKSVDVELDDLYKAIGGSNLGDKEKHALITLIGGGDKAAKFMST